MSKGDIKKDQERAQLQELSLLLENRTFVDYFNTFLSLPVFGQHVYYNFMEGEFEFEPPIRQRRHLYLDHREILRWLYENRYRLFRQSPLYTEYMLCTKLRNTDCQLPGIKKKDVNGVDIATFTRNVLGTAVGMLLFRESLRGTCGESVYRCWKDIEAWRHLTDPVRRMFWKYAIRTRYISDNSTAELKGNVKMLVYQGVLNFDLIPESEVEGAILEAVQTDHVVRSVESDEAMLQLQTLLLSALRTYWAPKHLVHMIKTMNKETLEILKRPVVGDLEYLSRERRLRCRFMFPTIYQESNISSPTTSVFVSKSAGDVPTDMSTPSLLTEDGEDESLQDDVLPTDLLSLWGGPAKDIEVDRPSAETMSCSTNYRSYPEEDSLDEIGRQLYGSQNASPSKHTRSPIPIVLTSYLGGKKRTLLGKFPQTSNRIIWSLASDMLACCPFRTFLERKEQAMDLQYLSFWNDVRTYLDTDDSVVDELGHPLRRMQSQRLVETYLSNSGAGCNLFSETLKVSMYQALLNCNDVNLLCMAQDIVLESLWEPLKLYISDERKNFLQQVRGNRYNLDITRRKQLDQMANQSKSQTKVTDDPAAPMYFFQCSTVQTDTATATPPVFSPNIPCSSVMSRPMTSYHTCITEEQMCKAMELAVLCSEFGTSMMMPQTLPKPEDLVDILYSDYGSLHVSRVAAVRHDWLRSLLHKPKINIETIRVSRKVFLDKIDLSKLKSKEDEKDEAQRGQRNRLVLRRNGFVLDRPTKPKSFIEVLTTMTHYDFFKRFMMVNKAGVPLNFWKAVEDLKELSNGKTRQIRVTQIMRKFFGKFTKYGSGLDCDEEIIRQIPNMDKVTPGILICAQAAVYRSMERKWYPQYLETYPPDSETSSPTNIHTTITPRTITPDFGDIVNKSKKQKRRLLSSTKTLMLWKSLCKSLLEFSRATSNKSEMQLLDIFLKCEVEKEQQTAGPPNRNTSQMQTIERNILTSNMAANVQTRVVIRNRLVIMNRLPADLRFWIEVRKYLELVDCANKKGNMSAQDTEFLSDKARSIIACFIASDVPPKVQINVPNDMAVSIINAIASSGPMRGLFHEAIILLFPLLYHFWRKFTDDWMNGDIPDDYIDAIEKTFKYRVASTPHPDDPIPDFTHIDETDIKTTTQPMMDENNMKIHFSILEGLSFVFAQPKLYKSPTNGGRRMTKHSLHALTEEVSPRRESRAQVHERRDSKLHTGKSSDKEKPEKREKPTEPKEKERKVKEKIIIKEEVIRKKPEEVDRRTSLDRARRLSVLVESLNKEREERVKEQNKRFSKMLTFEDVVAAAIKELSDSTSVFS